MRTLIGRLPGAGRLSRTPPKARGRGVTVARAALALSFARGVAAEWRRRARHHQRRIGLAVAAVLVLAQVGVILGALACWVAWILYRRFHRVYRRSPEARYAAAALGLYAALAITFPGPGWIATWTTVVVLSIVAAHPDTVAA